MILKEMSEFSELEKDFFNESDLEQYNRLRDELIRAIVSFRNNSDMSESEIQQAVNDAYRLSKMDRWKLRAMGRETW